MIAGFLGLLLMLFPVLYYDVRYRRIPNQWSLGIAGFGIVFRICRGGWAGLFESLCGLLIGAGIFFILHRVKAVGAGDVKLIAAIGAVLGIQDVLFCTVFSIIYAGLAAVLYVCFNRSFLIRLRNLLFGWFLAGLTSDKPLVFQTDRAQLTTIPFMTAVLPAVMTTGILVLHPF